MGGLSRGERAAEIAINEADRWWSSDLRLLIERNLVSADHIQTTLTALVHEIHDLIQSESKQYGQQMGTTISALLLIKGHYYTVHLGDSRVYEIGKTIDQLTKDHSWIQSEIDAGRLTEQEGANHPNRNALLQCAGMPGTPQVDINSGTIQSNNAYLLCSDGFYHYVNEHQFINLKEISEEEVNQWLAIAQQNVLNQKAHDNLTAIAVTTLNKSGDDKHLFGKLTQYMKGS